MARKRKISSDEDGGRIVWPPAPARFRSEDGSGPKRGHRHGGLARPVSRKLIIGANNKIIPGLLNWGEEWGRQPPETIPLSLACDPATTGSLQITLDLGISPSSPDACRPTSMPTQGSSRLVPTDADEAETYGLIASDQTAPTYPRSNPTRESSPKSGINIITTNRDPVAVHHDVVAADVPPGSALTGSFSVRPTSAVGRGVPATMGAADSLRKVTDPPRSLLHWHRCPQYDHCLPVYNHSPLLGGDRLFVSRSPSDLHPNYRISTARWTTTRESGDTCVNEGVAPHRRDTPRNLASDQIHRDYQEAIQVAEADRRTAIRADDDHLVPFIDLREYRRASCIVPRKDRPSIQTNAEPVDFHTDGTSTPDSETAQHTRHDVPSATTAKLELCGGGATVSSLSLPAGSAVRCRDRAIPIT